MSWYIVKQGHTLQENDKVYGYGDQVTAKQAARMPGLVSTEDPNKPKVEEVPQGEEVEVPTTSPSILGKATSRLSPRRSES